MGPQTLIRQILLKREDGTTLEFEKRGDTLARLYRIKHDFELGGLRSAAPCPEVYRMEPHHMTPMTEAVQWFCFDLLVQSANGNMTDAELKAAYRKVYGYQLFMTNAQGYLNDEDPRADYINGKDLGYGLPRYSALVLGGNSLTGRENAELNELEVNTINWNGPMPTGEKIADLRAAGLVQYATNLSTRLLPDKKSYIVHRFGQLNGADVVIPVLTQIPVRFPLGQLVKQPIGAEPPIPYVW